MESGTARFCLSEPRLYDLDEIDCAAEIPDCDSYKKIGDWWQPMGHLWSANPD